jgi:hypothetical protein
MISNEPAHPPTYEIIVEGCLDSYWSSWFEGLTLEALPDSRVRISGEISDQPALHGVLERIRDLNLVLKSVNRIA